MGTFLRNEVERNVRALMSVDDEMSWEQVGIYAKADGLGNEPLVLPPNTFTSSFTTGFPVILSTNPPSGSLVAPPATFFLAFILWNTVH
jgi:hypothetical protein